MATIWKVTRRSLDQIRLNLAGATASELRRRHASDKSRTILFNTLRPRQNGRHFPDDTFKRIFLNENVRISIKISLKFVPKGPINKIPALV